MTFQHGFVLGEQYENYLREFKKLYGKGELDTAKSQSDFAKFLEQWMQFWNIGSEIYHITFSDCVL